MSIAKQLLCTDDYGTAVYLCHYGEVPVWADDCRIVGSPMPQADVQFVVGNGPQSRAAEREALELWNQSEANCNTCRNLVRVPHQKRPGGILYGKCASTPVEHPYAAHDGAFAFCPKDHMGMKCWQPRGQGGTELHHILYASSR